MKACKPLSELSNAGTAVSELESTGIDINPVQIPSRRSDITCGAGLLETVCGNAVLDMCARSFVFRSTEGILARIPALEPICVNGIVPILSITCKGDGRYSSQPQGLEAVRCLPWLHRIPGPRRQRPASARARVILRVLSANCHHIHGPEVLPDVVGESGNRTPRGLDPSLKELVGRSPELFLIHVHDNFSL